MSLKNEEWFLTILAGIVAFAGYYGKTWIDKRKDKLKAKKVQKMIDGLRSIATVYQCMEHLHALESVGLVYLLEISDSGELPRAGSKIYARLIDIKVDEKSFEDRDYHLQNYGEFLVDEDYISMVLKTKESQKKVIFETDKEEPCVLKTIMLTEKVVYTEFYHVYSDTEKWKQYIVGISSGTVPTEDNMSVAAMIDNQITQIRYNFKKYR